MQKINPTNHIAPWTPTPEPKLDAAAWFSDEYISLVFRWNYNTNSSFGPGLGDYLPWFMAQGWTVYDQQSVDIGPSGGVYEYTYSMRRRKLQAERVLQSMINEFTDAYNEGRQINDQRYDEIVAIYNVALDQTETEITSSAQVQAGFETLINTAIGSIGTDFTDFQTAIGTLGDDYGTAQRADINARFDSELAKARQELVNRGMYNSTVWASASAGIERERARTLADVADKVTDRRVSLASKIHEARMVMRNKILESYERLAAMKRNNALAPLEYRNKMLELMLQFMERRTDDYPGLDGLATIAAQLGYSDGAAVTAPVA
jgi:hypothetical protein